MRDVQRLEVLGAKKSTDVENNYSNSCPSGRSSFSRIRLVYVDCALQDVGLRAYIGVPRIPERVGHPNSASGNRSRHPEPSLGGTHCVSGSSRSCSPTSMVGGCPCRNPLSGNTYCNDTASGATSGGRASRGTGRRTLLEGLGIAVSTADPAVGDSVRVGCAM